MFQFLRHVREERVALHAAHDVIGDACWDGAPHERLHAEEGVKGPPAPVVQVDVDATVVREDEVADRVGALDRVRVGVEGGEVGWVFVFDEVAGRRIRPEDVGVVGGGGLCRILGFEPLRGDGFVFVGLVDDAWDLLGGGGVL